MVDYTKPTEAMGLDLAFPAHVIGKFLPPEDTIPEEFKDTHNKWNALVSHFFLNGTKGAEVAFKDGIDPSKALRHIFTCLRSFEPQHEHKEAGVAYLMSLWFDDFNIDGQEKNDDR